MRPLCVCVCVSVVEKSWRCCGFPLSHEKMNFCGGEIDQQIVPDDYSSTALLSNSHMCGACVKSDMEDEDGHVVELITVLTDSREASEAGPEISRDDNVTSSCYTTNLSKTEVRLSSNRLELDSAVISKSAGAMPRKISQRPRSHAKTALDSIVETITSDEGDNLAKSSLDLSSFHRGNPNQSRSTSSCGRLQTPSSSGSVLLTTSPSPVLLNPLTHSNWESKPNLLCPVLERRNKPSPVEQLIVRLEDGFRVRFVGGPGSKNWKGHHLHFYLHHDRTRICVQSNPDADEKKDDASEFGFDLYVHRILKLEVNDGRPGRPRRSFTLVVNDNAVTTPVNYDFEARSTLEREVIVSTVLVLLDQSHHSKLPIRVDTDIPGSTQSRDLHNLSNETTIPIEEGTSDLPIPCSPSLGDDAASTETIISPRRHTRIYNDEEGTETSLIIHLEDIESRDPIDADDENELHARALVETSSQLSAMNFTSAHLISGNWCSDDVCTLALRDIADTCTGIFALKQEEPFTSCYNLVANDQALMVQEYFRSALGAPNAVYSYILESDVWSADRSVPQHGNEPSRPIKNRANVLNAQAIRLRKLRNEMTFAAALKQSEEKMHFVQTTQSFDDARHYSSKPPLKVANQAAQRLHSSPLLQHVIQSMKVSDGHTVESTENVDFYDSDPEDVKPRTLTSRGPRQAAADRLNVVEKNNIKNNDKAMSANFLEQIPFDKKVKKLDEDAVVDVVQVRCRRGPKFISYDYAWFTLRV